MPKKNKTTAGSESKSSDKEKKKNRNRESQRRESSPPNERAQRVVTLAIYEKDCWQSNWAGWYRHNKYFSPSVSIPVCCFEQQSKVRRNDTLLSHSKLEPNVGIAFTNLIADKQTTNLARTGGSDEPKTKKKKEKARRDEHQRQSSRLTCHVNESERR